MYAPRQDSIRYIYLVFSYDNKSPVSWIIRFLTWSDYSHVALVNPETLEIISSDHKKGVHRKTLRLLLKNLSVRFRRIPHPNPGRVWRIAYSQIGKEYDFDFLWGWIFRKDWQDPAKWSCSELIAWAAGHGGKYIISKDRIGRVTPEHLYMISEEIERSFPLNTNKEIS